MPLRFVCVKFFAIVISGSRRIGTELATETTPGPPPAKRHATSGKGEYGEDITC